MKQVQEQKKDTRISSNRFLANSSFIHRQALNLVLVASAACKDTQGNCLAESKEKGCSHGDRNSATVVAAVKAMVSRWQNEGSSEYEDLDTEYFAELNELAKRVIGAYT